LRASVSIPFQAASLRGAAYVSKYCLSHPT
jgi:hypothetical protein